MVKKKEGFSIIDWIGYLIGVVVFCFILFILLWPVIDPTPDKSSSLKKNMEAVTGK